MKCLTWNLQWAAPASKRAGLIGEQIRAIHPDVVCYTEVVRDLVPDGHCIEAEADYGYRNSGDRRKVILWSKRPWTDVDADGDAALPSGRFASGITCGICFVGVCIPWRDAHVRTGRRDRAPWEDHLTYCAGLKTILRRNADAGVPVCMLGDYNQRIPRRSQPRRVAEALASSFPPDFVTATAGMTDAEGRHLIDHFVVSTQLKIEIDQILPRFADDGTRLSDHVGVAASIEAKNGNHSTQGISPRTVPG